ncbi:Hypothetical predicted protein [Olea europaea subsp. europaea]|uniref:Uncharacterized protein n=1 Tax=Olea europaea subsp. europaea TaxID=158383 RepID=A0A8S0S9C7_OLEEU|nr:Hypothetical predicted protein [Olea europaea subsp. europaea]
MLRRGSSLTKCLNNPGAVANYLHRSTPKKWHEEHAQASSKGRQGVSHRYCKCENHLPTKRCNWEIGMDNFNQEPQLSLPIDTCIPPSRNRREKRAVLARIRAHQD